MGQHHRRSSLLVLLIVGTALVGGFAGKIDQVQAATIPLGGSGWQATWDDTLDPFVTIDVLDVVPGQRLTIRKNAEFTQGPAFGGLFPAIAIVFSQVDPNATPQIIIDEEVIINNTGVPWSDFHFTLTGGNEAEFDVASTNASGGGSGFFTSPFDNQSFGPSGGPPFTEFWVDGFGLGPGGNHALVLNGTQWLPGSGANGGELYIDVALGDGVGTPLTTFTLKERPSIPEPSALLLMFLGALSAPVTRLKFWDRFSNSRRFAGECQANPACRRGAER